MALARNGDVEIYYETFGDRADEALLFISGLGSQCITFRVPWCLHLAAMGYFVIRYDNRDVGLSTKSDEGFVNARPGSNVPTGHASRDYVLSDMAGDGLAVLDALGVERAHVVGVSMGAMIAQTMAIEHPHRMLTLTSIMSTTGDLDVGWPSAEARLVFLSRPPSDRDSFVAMRLASARAWGSPGCYDEEELTALAVELFERSFCPTGVARQLGAIVRSGSRTAALANVTVPTLVVHGDADRLIEQSGGRRTADAIPGARFVVIEGMGHDYPAKYWKELGELLHDHFRALPHRGQ